MVQINPSDLPALPVEQLAQFLLGCAREDPTLLARSNSGPLVHRDPEIRVPVRVPLGTPIDLTATPADPMVAPDDATERPARGMARPIEALAPRDNRPMGPGEMPAGPIDLTPWLDDNHARPIEALTGPIEPSSSDPSVRPIVPSFSRFAMPSGPVDATASLVARKLELRRPEARDDPELEELVSLAVACARRAEDAVQQAREISWMARRRMSVVASVAGAGVLAASAVAVLDRYHGTGQQASPTIASAFLAGPIMAGSMGNLTAPEPPTASPAGERSAVASGLAERAPAPDVARVVAEVSPPISPAPRSVATGSAVPAGRAVAAPVAVAASESAPVAPARPTPVPVATAVPTPAAVTAAAPAALNPARVPTATMAPATVAAVPPASIAPARPAATAAVAPPKPAEPGRQSAGVAEARASMPSIAPASVGTPASVGQSGNPSGGTPPAAFAAPELVPDGQSGVASASLDEPPTAQSTHPVRHGRRQVRRSFYYPRGPGVLLAQVVYGVRRNLYEIFHRLNRPGITMLTQSSAPRAATATSDQPGPGSSGLSVEDRRHLLAWVDAARSSGIDATEDLRMRPWPMPVSAQVIGVYRSGMTMATWLVVGQNGLWTVVSVSEGTVLATRPSLAAALAVIRAPMSVEATRPEPASDEPHVEPVAVEIPD